MPRPALHRTLVLGLAGIAALIAACADEEAITVRIPAGTELTVALASPLGSDATRVGDTFEAMLAEPVVHAGDTLLAKGVHVHGRILEVLPASAVEVDGARLTLAVDAVEVESGELQPLCTEPIRFVARKVDGGDEEWSFADGHDAVVGATARAMGGAALNAASGASGGTVLQLPPTDGGEVLLRTGQRIGFLTEEAADVVKGSAATGGSSQ